MRNLPKYNKSRQKVMTIGEKDGRDVVIARKNLAEIEANPDRVVRGSALDKKMQEWLSPFGRALVVLAVLSAALAAPVHADPSGLLVEIDSFELTFRLTPGAEYHLRHESGAPFRCWRTAADGSTVDDPVAVMLLQPEGHQTHVTFTATAGESLTCYKVPVFPGVGLLRLSVVLP